ncbi:457_t:CDS:2 [Ambispora leptoticha]|uniref:457_t:CDS:1 n=1 Tax=Ambispora leptoticha TaxID=144679 RepID=A0A9N8Z6Z6_9GLOM|nr:457_t:CDS:2 [Ambispora leptoticha]
MNYSYDSIERDLKKDLFRHFLRAKYTNSTEVSRNLITQFASDLDTSKLSVAAKRRYEEDNRVIYEKINNLEYIKAVSGEKYEERKISKKLDSTFQKNKKSLWYIVLFKAFPNYVIVPNIPTFFISLALTFTSKGEDDPVFLIANFSRYYFTISKLNSEVNKLIDSLLTLEEISSNLTIVNESVKILNLISSNISAIPIRKVPFENGDLVFQDVVFAYPKRPQQNILRNFSFRFVQGKFYGIAGKNGIGKSTITKATLKLYELKGGKILINDRNIQEIDTTNLHQRICYQTNRPTFFLMIQAAKQVGIYEFIANLPKGFATELREGGTDLSEGQKQQIAAMRMFINDYDIYILDEILSNVHPHLKDVVLQNIFKQLQGKTVLVIDHHYEIFRYVDYIYLFTGEELIAKDKEEFVS